MQNPSQEQIENWRNDPKNWKGNFNFYFNPEDKRVFPRKYYKEMGWTINFANTKSIMVGIALVVVVPVILILIISMFDK
jgi:uncharacterized membrane protein